MCSGHRGSAGLGQGTRSSRRLPDRRRQRSQLPDTDTLYETDRGSVVRAFPPFGEPASASSPGVSARTGYRRSRVRQRQLRPECRRDLLKDVACRDGLTTPVSLLFYGLRKAALSAGAAVDLSEADCSYRPPGRIIGREFHGSVAAAPLANRLAPPHDVVLFGGARGGVLARIGYLGLNVRPASLGPGSSAPGIIGLSRV
jgi:hypothetical protein